MKTKHSCHQLLLVEDNPVNQLVIQRQLQAMGYAVDVVANGQEALAAIERGRYDLVLMDCQMPELDGYEATRRLRRTGARLPVIALTAHAIPNVRERCLAAGMDDYLAKPAIESELRSMLRNWLPAAADPRDTGAIDSRHLS